MKCKFCKNNEFKEQGFIRHNRRLKCLGCGAIRIDKKSEKFEGYPEWMTEKEFLG